MKPFTKVASLILGIVALVHLVRLIVQFQVTVGSLTVPMWISVPALIVTATISWGLWREAK
jgi:hypothetical protein